MKKIAFFLTWVATRCVYALPQGNPWEPSGMEEGLWLCKENYFAWKGGCLGDWTWDARMKTEDVELNDPKNPRPNLLKCVSSECKTVLHLASVTVNALNQVEAYGLVGAGEFEFSHVPLFDEQERVYASSWDWAIGGGVRILGFTWKRFALGLDGKYLYARPSMKRIKVAGVEAGSSGRWEVRRGQIACGLSFEWCHAVPFVGVRYLKINDRLTHVKAAGLPFESFKFKGWHRVGGTVGLGFYPGDFVSLGAEYRFYDEFAASFFVHVKF